MREGLRKLGDWFCYSRLFGPVHIYSGFSETPALLIIVHS